MSPPREETLFHKVAGTGIFMPSIAVTWLVSGAITCAMQMVVFVTVYPFSSSLFVELNSRIVSWWWLIVVWIMEWWSELDVVISSPHGDFTERKTAVVLGNHAGDVDWMLGWYLASKMGLLRGAKAYMKKASLALPILGWSWYLADYVFLSRDWNKDKHTLNKTFNTLRNYPMKFWICLFAEGTRKSPQKLAESRAWCKANDKPVLQHVMWPRTKGFAATMMALEGKVEVLYDITMSPDPEMAPSFMKLLCAKPMRCFLNIKIINDIPKEERELKDLCEQIYIGKDKDLAFADKHVTFPYPVITKGFHRRWISRLSMYFWTTLVQGTIIYLLCTSESTAVRLGIVLLHVILGVSLLALMHYAEGGKQTKTA